MRLVDAFFLQIERCCLTIVLGLAPTAAFATNDCIAAQLDGRVLFPAAFCGVLGWSDSTYLMHTGGTVLHLQSNKTCVNDALAVGLGKITCVYGLTFPAIQNGQPTFDVDDIWFDGLQSGISVSN